MNALRVSNFALVMAVITLVGCATNWPGKGSGGGGHPPVNGGEGEAQSVRLEDVVFKFDEKGNLVPSSVNGVPFENCDSNGQRKCRIFSGKTEVLEVDTITITVIKHKNSPPCLFASTNRGRGGAGGGSVSEACPNQ